MQEPRLIPAPTSPTLTPDPETWPEPMREAVRIFADMFRGYFRKHGRLPVVPKAEK